MSCPATDEACCGECSPARSSHMLVPHHHHDLVALERLAQLRTAFDMCDADKDGKITSQELVQLVNSTMGGVAAEETVASMVHAVDINYSGTIEFREFLLLMTRQLPDDEAVNVDLQQAFEAFDSDSNALISAAELRHANAQMGEGMNDEEIDELIRRADTDGDAHMNYSEFAAVMRSNEADP